MMKVIQNYILSYHSIVYSWEKSVRMVFFNHKKHQVINWKTIIESLWKPLYLPHALSSLSHSHVIFLQNVGKSYAFITRGYLQSYISEKKKYITFLCVRKRSKQNEKVRCLKPIPFLLFHTSLQVYGYSVKVSNNI